MPLPRFAKLPPEKRRRILEVARAELTTHGYANASLNRVIAACGISKGAMYYYFADKADLFWAVVDDVSDRLEKRVRDQVAPPTNAAEFWCAIEQGMELVTAAAQGDPQLLTLGRALYRGGPPEGSSRLGQRMGTWVGQLLLRGRSLGAVRSDVDLPLLVAATTGMLMGVDRYVVAVLGDAERSETQTRVAVALCRDLLAPRSR